ncbi:MAG: hypothetical protein E6R06_10320 [Mycobacterium sp.]|jgi:hypothetical protein|nr:MAG: hypothetical protein E6R06_10320 [Mycobacterium sp.]
MHQISLQLRPIEIGRSDRPGVSALHRQFLPCPAGAVAVGGVPRGIQVTVTDAELDQHRAAAELIRFRELSRVVVRPGSFDLGLIDRPREMA